MGGLHKKARKLGRSVTAWGLVDNDTFEQAHPFGTQAETAYDLKKSNEKALKEAEADPGKDVIPIADEEELERARRRRSARARSSRSSTQLANNDGFGG